MTTSEFIAHARQMPDDTWETHPLADHLHAVGSRAATTAELFHSHAWAELAGRWHDLGKYRLAFQGYIRRASGCEPDAHIEGGTGRVTHSTAGALHAVQVLKEYYGPPGEYAARVLAYLIAGHHAGLSDWHAGLDDRLARDNARREYDEALPNAPADILALGNFELRAAVQAIPGRATAAQQPLTLALWIRLLFSALVDADFLDTEEFMQPAQTRRRTGFASPADLLVRLDAHLAQKTAAAEPTVVNRARADVLRQCREKAMLPPGVFTLTVPTGGGKTLSSLAFALTHAQQHGKRRVIYAIPYTSIIEQTATVFAAAVGVENLIEHHSQADADPSQETARSRLACENWDAPLIVTTTVQLFESLFAARTSRCRKLHNLVNSVIVLDEAQLLPPEFLQPILDVLNVLVTHYGVTLVLCTATQPALGDARYFDARKNRRGFVQRTEIIDRPADLFEQLKRVDVQLPTDWQASHDWPALAADIADRECVLAIVNTRNDALELTRLLPEGVLHLSAAMCGAHRQHRIAHIKTRLQAKQRGEDHDPLRVVSTQLVEAGVDIDFPVVYRAVAGLDSIAQAAGRCNREGRAARGTVVVFARQPPRALTAIRNGVQAAASVCHGNTVDPLAPATFERYFEHYYASFSSLDSKDIVADLTTNFQDGLAINFRTAADKFRLIDDQAQAAVVVPYAGIGNRLELLNAGQTDRWLLRSLQRYIVTIPKARADRLLAAGDVILPLPGLYVLKNALLYDDRFGLLPDDTPSAPDRLFW